MGIVHKIQNEILEIGVKQIGAELCSIKSLRNETSYIWKAIPAIWSGYSPILFPIIGALKDNTYFFQEKQYSIPRHGFVRNNDNVQLYTANHNSLTFLLKSDKETLEQYPFEFEFFVKYSLKNNFLEIEFEVINTASGDMLFSLGGHPAFKCPILPNETYSDYFLEFGQDELAHTYGILPNGLIGGKTDLIFNNTNIIDLHYNLFNKGALVFKDLKSKKVTLISRKSGACLSVRFNDFPFLGIWAKPNADYVCIEPWHGIADSVDTDQNFETKEGLIRLKGKNNFKVKYSIEVLNY